MSGGGITDELLALWLRTVVTVEGAVVSGAGAGPLPFTPPVHVLTAWNPQSTERSPADNSAADARLVTDLDAAGLAHRRATGADPEGTWAEDGHAVAGLDRPAAAELGRRYGQHAVYELTEAEVLVVECERGAVVGRGPRRR